MNTHNADPFFLAVQGIVSNVLEVHYSDINFESQMGGILNWDSMNNLRILFEIESEFNIKFDFVDLIGVRSVGDWVNLIKKYTS